MNRLLTPAVRLFGSQNDTSGAFRLNAAPSALAGTPHCALMNTPLNAADALSVKSTGRPAFGLVNVAVTGAVVPTVNAGIVTTAFVALISEKPCSPPVLIGSTVTAPGPDVIDVNWALPPGRVSVIVSVGVHTPGGTGVGVGVGGTGVGVGVGGTGVGVGVGGTGVGVGVGVGGTGVGVGVGAGPPVHCPSISTPPKRPLALNVKLTASDPFGIVNVAVTGLTVPTVNGGILITAFVAETTE